MSKTVTATAANGFDAVLLKVYVVTKGSESGGASSAVVSGAFGTPTFTLTPVDSGSQIVEGIYNAEPAPPLLTPNANNATDDDGLTGLGGNGAYWFGHWTGAVTGGTAITTLGGTNDDEWNAWAAYEVTPSGGSPAIDASTPAAVVGTEASATTAAFSPPAGSVLVAIVLTSSTAAPSLAVSDSDSLTWTERGTTYSAAFEGTSAVFTATVPGPPANSGGLAAPMMVEREMQQAIYVVVIPGEEHWDDWIE